MSRERLVARALVSLTDHLVSGDDLVDLLSELADNAVRLLEVDACGVLLADDRDRLHVVAASSGAARTLEMLQLQCDEGPCLDCFSTGRPVSVPDLHGAAPRWPAFVAAADELSFRSVYAIPLRLRDQVLGAYGLFCAAPSALDEDDVAVAEALGHVAGITLVAQRASADQRQLTEQLHHALHSRVVIEQCKGIIAAAGDLPMDAAFLSLRKYARDHNLGLTAVATAVVERVLPASDLLDHVRS